MAGPTECNHDFGPPVAATARMCAIDGCAEWGVCSDGETWVEPTPKQRADIGMIMVEDVVMADAFRMIHGPGGPDKYRRRAYGEGA